MDRSHLAYLAVAVIAAMASIAVARSLGRARRRWHARRRSTRAQRGERDAEVLLERAGYAVEGRQVSASWRIRVDGQPREIEVRADLVVSRRGKHYVAEVKTGDLAPRITTAATRRQLLEYRLAYDVDGVLLVDVEAARIVAVEFPLPAAGARIPVAAWAVALLMGIALGTLAAQLLPG